MCGGVRGVSAGGVVSSAFCLLFKLHTLRMTKKQARPKPLLAGMFVSGVGRLDPVQIPMVAELSPVRTLRRTVLD
jgi:hypothetical protein